MKYFHNVKQKTGQSKSRSITEQMVDSIIGKGNEEPTEREKGIRRHLSERVSEYLMFMDDDD